MALNNRISEIVKRVERVEARVGNIERQFADAFTSNKPRRRDTSFADKAHGPGYAWGTGQGEPYYHRDSTVGDYADLAGMIASVRPWLSTTARFSERLTSPEIAKTTALQSVMAGLCCAGVGAIAAWVAHYPLELIPFAGLCGFTLFGGVLLILDRTDRRALVRAQAKKEERRRQELRVQVDKPDEKGLVHSIDFLYVNGIQPQQLVEFAKTLRGDSLSVHTIGGRGKVLSQGQAQSLAQELESRGYAHPARGNEGRKLNGPGRALLRAIRESK